MEYTTEEISEMIEQCELLVKQKEKLDRLKANPDFQELIMEGYLKKLPAQLLETASREDIEKNPAIQESIKKSLDGVTAFHRYLNSINSPAVEAADYIVQLKEAQAEMEAEEQ